jgi:hypothetical protein
VLYIHLMDCNIYFFLPPLDSTHIPHFFGCRLTSLVRLDLSPYPIESIGFSCFKYADSLRELTLSRELGVIMSGSFRDLTSLQRLDLSPCRTLRVLDHDTFVGACSLQELILPEGLVEIRSGALRGLTSLETLTIPASVMTISFGAFGRCSRLKQVILRGHPEIDAYAFRECHPSLTFVHQSSSKVEVCSLQPGQAAAGGGRMESIAVKPSMHPALPSPHQCSSEVEVCSLQPGQAAAGGGRMESIAVKPSMHPALPSPHQCSSEVEVCSLQPGQASAGGGRMESIAVKPSMHPALPSPHQCSSEVEGCRLQPGQAAAGGGAMGAGVKQPFVHRKSPFTFACDIGRHCDLKGKLKFGQDDEGSECQITCEEFVADMEIVILPCGHAFSVDGMTDWYSQASKGNVPSTCAICNFVLQ